MKITNYLNGVVLSDGTLHIRQKLGAEIALTRDEGIALMAWLSEATR